MTVIKKAWLLLSCLLLLILFYGTAYAEGAASASDESAQASDTDKFSTRRPVVINYFGKVNATNAGYLARIILDEVANNNRDFHININSTGGDPDSGLAAFNIIESLPVTVTTFNANEVQSAAVHLYCLGERKYAYPESFFMIHPVKWKIDDLTMTDIQAKYLHSQVIDQRIGNIAESCMDISRDEIREYFNGNQDFYFTAEQAKSIGLVDEISSRNFIPKKVYLVSDDYRG